MTLIRTFKDAASDLLVFWTEQGNYRYNFRLKVEISDNHARICLTNIDGTLDYILTVCQLPLNEVLKDGIYYYRFDGKNGNFVREQDLFTAILSLKVMPAVVICKRVFGEVWQLADRQGNVIAAIARMPNDPHLRRDVSPQEFQTQTLYGEKR